MDVGLFFLIVFGVGAALMIFDTAVSAWRGKSRQFGQPFAKKNRPRPALHTEWSMTYDDGLSVRSFNGCGCPIGHDHWENGEWVR